jgi:hypothetical protein
MTHLILTGATGLVGSGTLAHMLPLTSPSGPISRLTILSRRDVPMAEGKENVKVVRMSDFSTYGDEIMQELKGAEGCVWALGVSVTQVGKEDYKKITVDYPIAAAKAFSTLNDNFKFVYVSGEGATTSPGPLTSFFGKVKGITERQLLDMSSTTPSLKAYSVRPAMVDPVAQPEIKEAMKDRSVPKWQQFLLDNALGPAIRTVWPGGTSPTKDLGKFLTDLALGNGKELEGEGVLEGRIITNKGFRRLAVVK